jgi:hypothetical protein
MLSIEGSNFISMGDGITISGGAFFGAGLGVRF